MTQSEKILDLLRERGEHGATNFELMKIAFQYPARIHTLRHKEGHNIEAKRIKDNMWKFTLVEDEPRQEEPEIVHAISWLAD